MKVMWQPAFATFLAAAVMQIRTNLRLLNFCLFDHESKKLSDQPFELLNPSAVHNKLCQRCVVYIIALEISGSCKHFYILNSIFQWMLLSCVCLLRGFLNPQAFDWVFLKSKDWQEDKKKTEILATCIATFRAWFYSKPGRTQRTIPVTSMHFLPAR